MNILITGGSGLVGYNLRQIYHNYQDNFIFLSSKDCDLTNFKDTQKIFEKYKPDCVVNLAAYVGGLFKNINCKVEMYENNI